MTLFAFLAAAVGPLAIRILAALGISLLTFVGVEAIVGQMVTYITSSWSGMSGDAVALLGLGGLGEGIGMVLGAINARLAMWSLASASRWVVGG